MPLRGTTDDETSLSRVTVRVTLRSGKLKGHVPGGDKMGYRIPESEIRRVLFGEPGKAAA